MPRSSLVLAVALTFGLAALAAAQAPADAESSFNAGLGFLRDGRPALAVEEFKKSVRQDGKNPYAYKGLGLAYAALKKYPDAIAAFRKALEINPYYVDVRNDLGTTLLLSGKRAEGRQELLSAFNDPTNPTPEISARNIANAYQEEKNYTEAASWYRTSLGRNKSYPDGYLGLADVLTLQGHTEDAIANLELGARECKDCAPVAAALGEAYLKVGRLAEARTRLEEARKKDPTGPSGRRAAELLQKLAK